MGEGTALGRVRGLGSAHHGSHHWLLQRFTAAGNLLTVGFLVTASWIAPALGHVLMHVEATTHGVEMPPVERPSTADPDQTGAMWHSPGYETSDVALPLR